MTDALWKPTTPTRADHDEFYYIACANRLAFGDVDHPPLAPALLALTRPAQRGPS